MDGHDKKICLWLLLLLLKDFLSNKPKNVADAEKYKLIVTSHGHIVATSEKNLNLNAPVFR